MTIYIVAGKPLAGAPPYGIDAHSIGEQIDLTLDADDEAALVGHGILAPPPPPASGSLGRFFGQNASTALPATTWTLIPLIAADEWQIGDDCFNLVTAGQYAGAMQCFRAGIYSVAGSVIFDPSNQTGDRGVRVTELSGTQTGFLGLITSGSMLKTAQAPMLVSGAVSLKQNDIIGLQAYSSVTTATTSNPNSEWLSAAWLG